MLNRVDQAYIGGDVFSAWSILGEFGVDRLGIETALDDYSAGGMSSSELVVRAAQLNVRIKDTSSLKKKLSPIGDNVQRAPALTRAVETLVRDEPFFCCVTLAYLLENHLTDSRHFHTLGLALRACDRRALAIRAFDTALKTSPPSFYTYWHAGLASLELENTRAALTYVEAAVRLRPSEPRGHALFAVVCAANGQWPLITTVLETPTTGLPAWIERDLNAVSGALVERIVVEPPSTEWADRVLAFAILALKMDSIQPQIRALFQKHEAYFSQLALDTNNVTDESTRRILNAALRSFAGGEISTRFIASEAELFERISNTRTLQDAATDTIRFCLRRGRTIQATLGEISSLGGGPLAADLRNLLISMTPPASEQEAPQVSVVVPAYNAARFLDYTLQSIQAQTFQPFECIIVNDCSTDKTKSIIDRYVKADRRFRCITHKANSGLSAARNTGLRAATGKYVCFLDADDLMMPNALAERVKTLNRYPMKSVIGTYCGSATISENAQRPPESKETSLRFVDFVGSSGRCPFNANQPLLKTEALRDFGGFDESLTQAEDYDLWMRILRAGYMLAPTNFVSVTYRDVAGSMVRRAPLTHLKNSMSLFNAAHSDAAPNEDGPPVEFGKSWSSYQAQVLKCDRILEFCGMALARGDEMSDILAAIRSELPDFSSVACKTNPVAKLLDGVQRYFCTRFGPDDAQILQHFTIQCAKLIGLASEKPHTPLVPAQSPGSERCIIFIPHKDYHVWTIHLIARHLETLGFTFKIVDPTVHYRDEGVRRKAKELDLPLVGLGRFVLNPCEASLVVCFNDWDPIVRSLILAAKASGIATAAIVEGVQDYMDADTGRKRHAYRSADFVLLPGEFDARYFADNPARIRVAGVPRIHELFRTAKPLPKPTKRAVINSNFSYGVLTDARDEWVRSAVRACTAAGFTPVVSRHPADLGVEHENLRTGRSFYADMADADVMIGRFGSGILEALAMDRGVIYFNPHHEQIDKFKEPRGAYPVVETEDDLVAALTSRSFDVARTKRQKFLDAHTASVASDPAVEIATALCAVADAGVSPTPAQRSDFKAILAGLERHSNCFSNIEALKRACIAPYTAEGLRWTSLIGVDPIVLFSRTGLSA